MKVLHLNTNLSGGAAKSAIRIHRSLLNLGIDSIFLSLEDIKALGCQTNIGFNKLTSPELTLKNYFLEKLTKKFSKEKKKEEDEKRKRYKKLYTKYEGEYEIFSTPFSEYDITKLDHFKDADIIHLHWVSGLLDYESFFKKNDKPLVWTLHDENPYKGAFHYENDEIRNFKKFVSINQDYINIKKKSYELTKSMTFVSPSNWLKNKAISSGVMNKFSIYHQYYGIDLNVFRPISKEFSKSIFHIDHSKKVFLFVSEIITNYRKGFDLISSLLKEVEFNDVVFLVVGSLNFEFNGFNNVIYLGKIEDERLMNIVYNASDFFILPSREDNLPNTMIESLCSGTPVISFDISDNRSIIEKNDMGIICDEISEIGLKKAMVKCLSGVYNFDQQKINNKASKMFSYEKSGEFYVKLYSDILSNSK